MATRRIPVPKIEGSIPSGIISFLVFFSFDLSWNLAPDKNKTKRKKKNIDTTEI
jgi:hypothetical protein